MTEHSSGDKGPEEDRCPTGTAAVLKGFSLQCGLTIHLTPVPSMAPTPWSTEKMGMGHRHGTRDGTRDTDKDTGCGLDLWVHKAGDSVILEEARSPTARGTHHY